MDYSDEDIENDSVSVDSSEVEEWLRGLREKDPHSAVFRGQDEMPNPHGVDTIFNFELIEDSNAGESRKPTFGPYPECPEPDTILNEDGLPPPHTCRHCKHVIVRDDHLVRQAELHLCSSRDQLCQGRRAGCTLMHWLEWFVYEVGNSNEVSHYSDISLRFRTSETTEPYDTIEGTFSDWAPNLRSRRAVGSFGPFPFHAPSQSPASPLVSTTPVNLRVGSNEAFETARLWLDACNGCHSGCASRNGRLPGRLLEVDDKRLHLSSPTETQPAYATLSYCWGGDQVCKTTLSNVDERFEQGIPISALPKTIEDALMVCRNLEIPYLWVDSLCIIQDDPDDVRQELEKMCDIYSGSQVTVSAASASGCDEGFLQRREPSEMRRHTVALKYVGSEQEEGWLFFHHSEQHDPSSEVINSRAWTYQEALLSPRLLIYRSWQMRWICRTGNKSDGGAPQAYYRSLEHQASRLHSQTSIRELELRVAPQEMLTGTIRNFQLKVALQDMYDLWAAMVHEYTRRKLSVPADRVAAFDGIAQKYSELCGEPCIGGLFEQMLPGALLWKRASKYGDDLAADNVRKRSPSWSWCSIDEVITFPNARMIEAATHNYAAVTLSSDIRYSAVKDLTVKGRMRLGLIFRLDPDAVLLDFMRYPGDKYTYEEKTRLQGDLALAAKISWDCSPSFPSRPHLAETEVSRLVFCVEIITHRERDDGPLGLVLEPTDEKGQYRRIGVFSFEGDESIKTGLKLNGRDDYDERRAWMRRHAFVGSDTVDMNLV